MKLTEAQVRYVAGLANLYLSDRETASMAEKLAGILQHMDRLAAIDTEGVEPMRQVLHEFASPDAPALTDSEEAATLRPDVERAPLGNELALANAPAAGHGYFKVPKVIER